MCTTDHSEGGGQCIGKKEPHPVIRSDCHVTALGEGRAQFGHIGPGAGHERTTEGDDDHGTLLQEITCGLIDIHQQGLAASGHRGVTAEGDSRGHDHFIEQGFRVPTRSTVLCEDGERGQQCTSEGSVEVVHAV
jgi:hypothetical protein